jgi:hypothetical protein
VKKIRPFSMERRLRPFSWNRTAATASVHFLHSFCIVIFRANARYTGAGLLAPSFINLPFFRPVVNPEREDFFSILHSLQNRSPFVRICCLP